MFTNIQQAGTRDAEAHGRGSSAGRSEFRDMTVVAVVVTGLWHGMVATPSAQPSGEAIYRERCAGCHDLVTARIPPRDALRNMSSARILRALDFGVMMNVAYPLRRDEREAVATFLGKAGGDPAPPPSAFCAERTAKLAARPKIRWNGWSPTDGNVRFQPADQAMLTVEQVSRLELKWAFAFDGDIAAFAQPTILDRALFVGSAGGLVHAIDVDSGCLHWVFQANGPVRSALLAVARRQPARADVQRSRRLGLRASMPKRANCSGRNASRTHETTRLTGAAAVYNGTVFIPVASWEESRAIGPNYPCCTFRGSVVALKIADGSQVWKTYTIAEERAATRKESRGNATMGTVRRRRVGIADRRRETRRLYVTTGDNYSTPPTNTSDAVMALDIKTGRIVWSRQMTPRRCLQLRVRRWRRQLPARERPGFRFRLVGAAGQGTATAATSLVAGQKSGVVYALDPDRQGADPLADARRQGRRERRRAVGHGERRQARLRRGLRRRADSEDGRRSDTIPHASA